MRFFWQTRQNDPASDFRRIRRQLRQQERALIIMSQALDNLKAQVADTVSAIDQAIERIENTDDPAEVQAEVGKLAEATNRLYEALSPPAPTS